MGKDKYETENFDNYKNYVGQLENEYLTTFKKIEVYINEDTKLNSLEKNNCFLQILDTFLSSQVEDKSLKDITGVNLKKYCDDMIYGQTIYSYKISRICFLVVGALFYVSFMHFFTGIWDAIYLKDSSIIFQPMKFGIGEIILLLGYICIPKLIAVINRNYFKNPARCKKIKRYTYYSIWLLTIGIYTLMKEPFNIYGIFIPFSTIILILIYSAIVCAAVWLVSENFKTEKLEKREEKMKQKYFEILNKQYEKHKAKCVRRNKDSLEWNQFLKKKVKENYMMRVLFFIYSIIFFGLAILLGWVMLSEENINPIGIIILIVISLFDLFIFLLVKEGINSNKQLAQMEE